jgi:hypothetical protein
MSNASDYLEPIIADIVTGRRPVPSAAAANRWLALYTASPTDADSGTEVTGGSYARVQIANTTGPVYSFPAGSGTGGAVTNNATITFPTATGSWGTVTHFGIRDASTGGNLLVWGALTSSVAPVNGNVVQFDTGSNTLTITVA